MMAAPYAKENPAAAATADGANVQSWFDWFDNNTRRESKARALIDAVVACDPSDRLIFLETIFEALRPGEPIPPFMGIMSEARDWASWASRTERKAYLWACWEHLASADQSAFLAHVSCEVAA